MTAGCCLPLDEGVRIYNDPSDPQHPKVKSTVDACTAALEARDEDGAIPAIHPPSEVLSSQQQGMMHYREVAFLAESDITHYLGLSSKALGLNMVNRPNEYGTGFESGCYISMRGLDLPLGDLLSLRKTRVWTQNNCVQNEMLLQPSNQLCTQQGLNTYEYVCSAEVRDRPSGLSSHGPGLPTMQCLRTKADKINAERAQEASGVAASAPAQIIELGSIANKRGMNANPKKGAKKPKKEKESNQAEEDAVSASKVSGSTRPASKILDEATSMQFKAADPELHEVVVRLGYLPDCFVKLREENCFGNKMGRSIFQATNCSQSLQILILRPSQHVYPCFSLQIFDSEAVSTCLSVF